MNYAKCTMPDTRPGVTSDEDGRAQRVPPLRRAARMWTGDGALEGVRGLRAMSTAAANGPGGYDCAVAVSGGKDSHFQVWMLKEVTRMNPILFSVEDNFPMTEAGMHSPERTSARSSVCTIISCKPDIKAQKDADAHLL